ncbi:WAP domain containing protein, SLPI-like [Trichuris trichiura]|uniref:WAP domain containing protein, SLPI-like n=1 Tax=Trichuris trichiura TaxID=36087 RepID=A0A077YXI1_TRITR|nr:WAP domain containing protein, SLPI-like [Trichuris trichiura]
MEANSRCHSEGQCLHDHAEEITTNLTFVKGRQSPKEVCPDGTNPLKYCCRSHCPFGYYCFYGVCCKHLKPGTCPNSFSSTGIPAGPPCDNDLECPWKLKCCEVNNNTRCVFPDKYIGGTVTRETVGQQQRYSVLPSPAANKGAEILWGFVPHCSDESSVLSEIDRKGNCPDGSYPLKHCTPNGCPVGYYCHYDLCCQHTKPGSCPWKLPNGVGAAGPPCDSDIDCSYNLKCCQINGRSRCVFPYGYSGGTVGVNSPATGPVAQAPAMVPSVPVASPVVAPAAVPVAAPAAVPVAAPAVPVASPGFQYGYEMYGSPMMVDPYMGGYMGYGDFGMFPGYGGIYG